MKLIDIPQSTISPVCRIIMLNRGERMMMIKVADYVSNEDAERMIRVADDMARISQLRAGPTFDYVADLTQTLADMNIGFEVIVFP